MNRTSPKAPIEYSVSTQSPVSFSSIALSPIPNRHSQLSKRTEYKSPNTTPTNLCQRKSIDESINYTEKKSMPRNESLSKLSQKLLLKERQIRILEDENKRLTKIKDVEKWEKELVVRNQDVRKLEFQVNYYKTILKDKVDSTKLIEKIESQCKKIIELEILIEELQSGHCKSHESEIRDLKNDNITLISALNEYSASPTKEDWEKLSKKLKDSKKNSEFLVTEKNNLMEELQRFKRELPPGSLIYFSQDISKIKKEVNKLAKIGLDVQNGKEISLKHLLGIDIEYNNDPGQQLCKDIQSIKQDLNSISNVISDLLAGHCAEIVCKTQ